MRSLINKGHLSEDEGFEPADLILKQVERFLREQARENYGVPNILRAIDHFASKVKHIDQGAIDDISDEIMTKVRELDELCDQFYEPFQDVIDAYGDEDELSETKQRIDDKCWDGYKKEGTKIKNGVKVNNCVPVKESNILKGIIMCKR